MLNYFTNLCRAQTRYNGGAAEAPGHLPQPRGRAGGRAAVGQGGRASAAGHLGPGQPRQQNVAKSLLIALCYKLLTCVTSLAVSGHGDEAELPLELRGDESGGGRQAGAGPQLSAGGGVRAAPGGPHPARGRHPHPSGHHRGQHRSMKILTNLDFKLNFAS